MTLVPWLRGRSLVWDFACVDTFATSNLPQTSQNASAAAEKAERAKIAKYTEIPTYVIFQPVVIETLGPWSASSLEFIRELGQRLALHSGEQRSTSYLIQRLSMVIQRGNAASILGTLPVQKKLSEIFYF